MIEKEYKRGEAYYIWRDAKVKLSFKAPARLMDDARKFFEGTGVFAAEHRGFDFTG